ncbi:hypothetical protein [Lysinibacillus capsici]|uniref:hypothetical protein n=1 Tax=Lysinibacillus capsici TaxID=2115968 RepID=UPI001CD94247|nr:hypothetical protein [Lysinibacillus capsici]
MRGFLFYIDIGREVSIHPATKEHGTNCYMSTIKLLEQRIFTLPENTIHWIKLWDYAESKG